MIRTSADVTGCFSAAEKVLQLKSRTDEQTSFLMSLLDALEQVSVWWTQGRSPDSPALVETT